jgi:D-amino-acid oxidase
VFDVAVVGGGVVGLTTALRLLEHGARVCMMAAEEPDQVVSWVAAAVWYPTHVDGDPRILAWGTAAFDELARQAGQGVPGVVMRPTRMLLRNSTATPWWASAVPDFRLVDAAAPYTGEWQFTVPSVEMGIYLPWLLEQFRAAGGELRAGRLQHLNEACELAPSVVNATGLGAAGLAPDPGVFPIRGRVVVVANPGLTTSWRDEDDPAGQTYIHPRSTDVVLGGTFEPMVSELTTDPDVSAAIIRRCTALVPELTQVRVISERVGLRPARHGGPRVEADANGLAGGVRLIHNYGHAGAGVTLSWGCADEVARLLGFAQG